MNSNNFFEKISQLVHDSIAQGQNEIHGTHSMMGRVALFDEASALAEEIEILATNCQYFKQEMEEADKELSDSNNKLNAAIDEIAVLEEKLEELLETTDALEQLDR